MNSSDGKINSDIEEIKERLSKNREQILKNAQKIESGFGSLDHMKKLKANKNRNKF